MFTGGNGSGGKWKEYYFNLAFEFFSGNSGPRDLSGVSWAPRAGGSFSRLSVSKLGWEGCPHSSKFSVPHRSPPFTVTCLALYCFDASCFCSARRLGKCSAGCGLVTIDICPAALPKLWLRTTFQLDYQGPVAKRHLYEHIWQVV